MVVVVVVVVVVVEVVISTLQWFGIHGGAGHKFIAYLLPECCRMRVACSTSTYCQGVVISVLPVARCCRKSFACVSSCCQGVAVCVLPVVLPVARVLSYTYSLLFQMLFFVPVVRVLSYICFSLFYLLSGCSPTWMLSVCADALVSPDIGTRQRQMAATG